MQSKMGLGNNVIYSESSCMFSSFAFLNFREIEKKATNMKWQNIKYLPFFSLPQL